MSAPASDPPQDPPTGTGSSDVKPGDASSSASSSTGETVPEGDVKMEEAPKPETIEDTLEDIPDHVKEVGHIIYMMMVECQLIHS
jgi:hypothetical protein